MGAAGSDSGLCNRLIIADKPNLTVKETVKRESVKRLEGVPATQEHHAIAQSTSEAHILLLTDVTHAA
jgi:hypothetical protein